MSDDHDGVPVDRLVLLRPSRDVIDSEMLLPPTATVESVDRDAYGMRESQIATVRRVPYESVRSGGGG